MSELYLIWSNEHSAWWGPGEMGYRPRISQAGRYTREKAIEIVRRAEVGRYRMKPMNYPQSDSDYSLCVPPEIMVREDDAMEALSA